MKKKIGVSIIYIPASMLLVLVDIQIIKQIVNEGINVYNTPFLLLLLSANILCFSMSVVFYKKYRTINRR